MDRLQWAQTSRRLLSNVLHADHPQRPPRLALFTASQLSPSRNSAPLRRNASSTTSINNSKPIVLEQPDKFRPPSHPQRLVRPRSRPQGAAYNQESTEAEKNIQKKKRYPHMFPREGSAMHWFLTNRYIHVYITLGTLILLALYSIMQTFMLTSPYAHLMPPLSSLPYHPINYVTEAWAVFRLNMEYTTAQAAESRRQKILDAQKRRLYRRAHGMEDLDAEEDQGVDVAGLVPWDDGLTKKEREAGGRRRAVTGRDVVEMGGEVGEDIGEFVKRKKAEAQALRDTKQRAEVGSEKQDDDAFEKLQAQGQGQFDMPQKTKRKLFFGIW